MTGLARTSVRMTVLIIGTLVLLSSFGIAITPILTALVVGDYVKLSLESVEGFRGPPRQ